LLLHNFKKQKEPVRADAVQPQKSAPQSWDAMRPRESLLIHPMQEVFMPYV